MGFRGAQYLETSVRVLGLVAAALLTAWLCACATPVTAADIAADLQALQGAQAILLGEQHDNPDHQRIERDAVEALVAGGRLAALVLEMAEQGQTTRGLPATATPEDVKGALQWDERAWTWARYEHAVMAAVRGGVPVLGANLPRARMRSSMRDVTLDARLDATALQTQQNAIREGHCDALPPSQIGPMTRIQIARDLAMADTLTEVVAQQAKPGQTALLLAGSGHVDKTLGVPRHLKPGLRSVSVILGTGTPQSATEKRAGFDRVWAAGAIPDRDYCEEFKANRAG